MTEREVAAFIVARWQMGHTPALIRQQLLMLSVNLTDAKILASIRLYCDCTSENVRLKAKEK